MRILFIANAASVHTVRWVNALSKRGHEIHLAFKYDDFPRENKIDTKVFLHRLNYSGNKGYFLNALQLNKLFKSINPDVVNAHYASGYGTLARLSRLKPLILSVWGADVYEFPYRGFIYKKLLLDNLKYADCIASTSNSMANHTKTLIGDLKKDIYVTPFGVDIEKFTNNFTRHEKKEIVIGTVKSLKPKYGIDDFVRSIKILKDSLLDEDFFNKNIKVKIYGDGEQKEYIQNLIKNIEMETTITLEGKIPNEDVPKVLRSMDIFVSSSVLDSESFGVSLVEAMAVGLPVIATDVSGFKEVVESQNTGIIIERRKPDKIAEALKKLILNKDLRLRYGINGRKRAELLYNWENNVSTMEEIYNFIWRMNC